MFFNLLVTLERSDEIGLYHTAMALWKQNLKEENAEVSLPLGSAL